MRIATWNINGLTARLDYVRHWLRARRPDVVGLQELKTADDKFPYDDFEEEGYSAVVHGQKAWNGVAILSREPAEVVQKGLPGQEDLGARLITARIGELSFTTVYCPNGKHTGHPDFPRKLAWFDALAEHLAQNHDPQSPGILCGDFNIC
ncbi:MAG: exodeoxyribonuclease III, partial [Thermoanaerobaculia bacterium]